jgi:hypothetical protein
MIAFVSSKQYLLVQCSDYSLCIVQVVQVAPHGTVHLVARFLYLTVNGGTGSGTFSYGTINIL